MKLQNTDKTREFCAAAVSAVRRLAFASVALAALGAWGAVVPVFNSAKTGDSTATGVMQVSSPLADRLTFSAWFRSDAAASDAGGDFNVIFALGGLNGQFGPAILYMDNRTGKQGVGIRLQPSGATASTAVKCFAAGNWSDGKWHQLVATCENGSQVVYVDGVQKATAQYALGTLEQIPRVSVAVDAAATTSRKFEGSVQEVTLWNKVLTAGDVQAAFASKSRLAGNESGLVGYWPMDDVPTVSVSPNGSFTETTGCSPMVYHSGKVSWEEDATMPLTSTTRAYGRRTGEPDFSKAHTSKNPGNFTYPDTVGTHPVKWFNIGGKELGIVVPENPLPGKPWMWAFEWPWTGATTQRCVVRDPTNNEKNDIGWYKFIEAGYYYVYLDVGMDCMGNDATMQLCDQAYRFLTRELGFDPQFVSLGVSRGGWNAYRFAQAFPERFKYMYNDAPVCDLRSWPGLSDAFWGRYRNSVKQFHDDAERLAWDGAMTNLWTLAPIAVRGVKMLNLVGDRDTTVAPEQNTLALAKNYRALGGRIEVVVKPDYGHVHGMMTDEITPLVEKLIAATETVDEPCAHASLESFDAVPALCLRNGRTAGRRCLDCGQVVSGGDWTPMLGHDIVTSEAGGESCSRCHTVYSTRSAEGCPHANQVAAGPSWAASCLGKGVTAGMKCADCGKVLTAQTSTSQDITKTANEHPYDTVTDEGGKVSHTCSKCGIHYVEGQVGDGDDEDDPSGHKHAWSAWAVTTPATCTAAGEETRTCAAADCPTPTQTHAIAKFDHDWGEWEITTAPQVGVAGEKRRGCTRCDAFETEAVDPLPDPGTDDPEPQTTVAGTKVTVTVKDWAGKTLATVNGVTFDGTFALDAKDYFTTDHDIDYVTAFDGGVVSASSDAKRLMSGSKVTWSGLTADLDTAIFVQPFAPIVPRRTDGPDPYCMKDPTTTSAYWVYTYTTGSYVGLYRTSTFDRFNSAPTTLGHLASGYTSNVWAPEVHCIDGNWYVYYSASSTSSSDTERSFVMAYTGANASGLATASNWQTATRLVTPDDKWAIDGTVFKANGQLYYVWSGWPGDRNGQQNIYLAPMATPTTFAANAQRTLVSAPTESWERQGNPVVNEGPAVLQRNGKVTIVYSGSGSWTQYYALGYATCSDGDLTNPASWKKHSGAVFSSRTTADAPAWAPGHCSFMQDKDGRDYIVYHAQASYNFSTGKWSWPGQWKDRGIRTQPFAWHDDEPVFGVPRPTARTEAWDYATLDYAGSGFETRTIVRPPATATVTLGTPNTINLDGGEVFEVTEYSLKQLKTAGSGTVSLKLSDTTKYVWSDTIGIAPMVTIPVTVVAAGDEPEPVAHEHVMGLWQLKTEPTCQAAGISNRVCQAEGCTTPAYEETAEAPTVDHVYEGGECKWCHQAEPQDDPGTGGGGEPEQPSGDVTEDPMPGHEDWGTVATYSIGNTKYTAYVYTKVGEAMTFEVPAGVTSIVYLVVGGGGSGGARSGTEVGGAGGGGGGVLSATVSSLVAGQIFTVNVGAGADGVTGKQAGKKGGDSSLVCAAASVNAVAEGGGAGGQYGAVGGDGGCGGGGGGQNSPSQGPAGGTGSQGNDGGHGYCFGMGGGGGAGGTGGAGGDATAAQNGGDGGAGFASSIAGMTRYYAAGGAGAGALKSAYTAGTDGAAATDGAGVGENGLDGLGAGGGGQKANSEAASGAGGSGTVIVRYEVSVQPGTGPTVDGRTVDPAEVFKIAKSGKPIIYPSAPDVVGEFGAQTITFGSVTVKVPRYYTATLDGNTVSLALNDNAKPTFADGDDGIPAFKLTANGVELHLTNVEGTLFYQLQSCTKLGDWTPVGESKMGVGNFDALRSTDAACFYRVVVRDTP